MDIEQLRLILDMLQEAGQGGSNLVILYLGLKLITPVLIFTFFMTLVLGIFKLVKRGQSENPFLDRVMDALEERPLYEESKSSLMYRLEKEIRRLKKPVQKSKVE